MNHSLTCLSCGKLKAIVYKDYAHNFGQLNFCYECAIKVGVTNIAEMEGKVKTCIKCYARFIPKNDQAEVCQVCNYLKWYRQENNQGNKVDTQQELGVQNYD